MVLAPTRVFEAFFLNPGGDQPVFSVAWWRSCDCLVHCVVGCLEQHAVSMVVSVGVLVAGARVGVWWLWVSRVLVTVLFQNCIVDASIFFF